MDSLYPEHHRPQQSTGIIREIIFGMEDGMVSTFGAITGIAAGAHDRSLVLLSGLVVIAVESISMGVGSYLSNKSEREISERKIAEEKEELRVMPLQEEQELKEMYVNAGWPAELAPQMAAAAAKDKKLILEEMAFRELKIIPDELGNPLKNGLAMGISYVIGGSIPLLPYFLSPDLKSAISFSVPITLAGLFLLGVVTTRFTKRRWWKAGLEVLLLASAAGLIGYGIGYLADIWFGTA